MKIKVYPKEIKKQLPNCFKALLYPANSSEPLLYSEHQTREEAERSIRSWLELEPNGKGEVITLEKS